MPWNGGPAGNNHISCTRDPRKGGEALSSATIPGGNKWEKHLQETAAHWNSGRVGRMISRRAEEGRTPCNVGHSDLPPQGPPSAVLSCDRFVEDFLDWSTTLRSGIVPEAPDFLERRRPCSHCRGAWEATLCFWISLYEELVHGWGCSRPAAPRTIERRGRNR